MNFRNEWKQMLSNYNESLKDKGIELVVNEDEGNYSVQIKYSDGTLEDFAENYYEDELEGCIREAYGVALAKSVAHIKNKWMVVGTNGEKQPFNTIEAAKQFCVKQTAFVKQFILFGGKIIHVVNDEIISEVTIDKVSGDNSMVLFSDVHIYNKPVKYNYYGELEQAILECSNDDYELSKLSLNEKARHIYKIVLDMIKTKGENHDD